MNRSNPGDIGRSITAPSGGADFLQLNVSEAPAGGLADWLAGRLRSAISDGHLPLGSRLPATRVLAAELQVSRGIVTEAYQRLTEDGHVIGRGRAGTVVVAAPIAALPHRLRQRRRHARDAADPSTESATLRRWDRAAGVVAVPGLDVFDVMRAAPGRIDLTPGVPDLAAFPRAAWLKAERTVLADLSASAFGYGDPAGTPALRLAVATWLARNRGIKADPDDLIIVAGVAQASG